MSLRKTRFVTALNKFSGFTLVELLVVIGIIALLISVLLPALNNARESANRTKCLSNVRQFDVAIVMYCNENKGIFPVLPQLAQEKTTDCPSEILHWELDAAAGAENKALPPASGGKYDALLANMGVGPYLHATQSNTNMLRCPSDPTWQTRISIYNTAYSFSYSVNWSFNGASLLQSDPWCIDKNAPYPVNKITQVSNSSDKILVVEEDQRTLDDACCSLSELPAFWGYNNRLAIRHDMVARVKPDPEGLAYIPNGNGKGNVGFVDGHASYVRGFTPMQNSTAWQTCRMNQDLLTFLSSHE